MFLCIAFCLRKCTRWAVQSVSGVRCTNWPADIVSTCSGKGGALKPVCYGVVWGEYTNWLILHNVNLKMKVCDSKPIGTCDNVMCDIYPNVHQSSKAGARSLKEHHKYSDQHRTFLTVENLPNCLIQVWKRFVSSDKIRDYVKKNKKHNTIFRLNFGHWPSRAYTEFGIMCTSLSVPSSLFLQGIPYSLYAGSEVRFIVHLSLCGLGLLLAIITFVVQIASPAPYGKHENKVHYIVCSDEFHFHYITGTYSLQRCTGSFSISLSCTEFQGQLLLLQI